MFFVITKELIKNPYLKEFLKELAINSARELGTQTIKYGFDVLREKTDLNNKEEGEEEGVDKEEEKGEE